MDIKKKFNKNFLRQNFYLECLSYIIQNNLLRKINFSGSGNWEPTLANIYNRFMNIANVYLDFLRNEKIKIAEKTLIIELGVGFSTCACLELSKKTKCFKVVAYDAFMALDKTIDRTIKEKYFPDISNVNYILGVDNLKEFFVENLNKYDKIVVFSTSVLQHVWNVEELLNVIDKSSPVNSVHFHIIDLRNLNKFNKYGALYFLKFSNFMWSLMAKNVGHQNRLRYDDYVDIFNKIGYKIVLQKAEKFKDVEVQLARQTYLKNKKISKSESLNYSVVTIKCIKIR